MHALASVVGTIWLLVTGIDPVVLSRRLRGGAANFGASMSGRAALMRKRKAPGKPSSVVAAIEDVLDQDTQQQKVENL